MTASAGNLLGTKLEVGEEIKIREDAAVAASACKPGCSTPFWDSGVAEIQEGAAVVASTSNLLGTVLGVGE